MPRMIPSKYKHEVSCAIEQSYTNGRFDMLNAAYKFLSPEDFLTLVRKSKLGFEHFMDGGMSHIIFMASLENTTTISDLIIDATELLNVSEATDDK